MYIGRAEKDPKIYNIFNRVPIVVGDEKVCRLVSQVMREFSSVLFRHHFICLLKLDTLC